MNGTKQSEENRAIGQVGTVRFNLTTFDAAVEYVLAAAEGGDAVGGIRLSNAWCVVLAEKDPEYRRTLNAPGKTYPDGKPVADLLRLLNEGGSAQRVRGPSLFSACIDRSQSRQIRHYFVGSTPATLECLVAQVGSLYPHARVAGYWSPPFGPVSDELTQIMIDRIVEADANIVWVGMGSPKQDAIANTLSMTLGVPAVGVGAAFDFVAGTVREAPGWMQKLGLEWLFRLMSEPKRLWRRYLVGNVQFLFIAARTILEARVHRRRGAKVK